MRNANGWLIGLALLASACDEGRIYDMTEPEARSGLAAVLTLDGGEASEQWPEGYSLALAGFSPGSEYAVISKNVKEGERRVVLTGIPSEVSDVEFCAIDRLRRRVATFSSVPARGGDTLRFRADNAVDLSAAGAIQREVFDRTCVNCHGGSNFAAAGLNLTAGRSFGELVGVQSVKVPGEERVSKGNPEESVLWLILGGTESAEWSYDHSAEVSAPEKLELIKNWIKSLNEIK